MHSMYIIDPSTDLWPLTPTLPSADTTAYFGVGFYQGNRGVGRDYQMAFYNVQSPSNGPLSVVTDITTRIAESWLKCKYMHHLTSVSLYNKLSYVITLMFV